MIEKTLDHQIFEDVFGNKVTKDTIIPPYSSNLDWAFRVIKYHQNNGGWIFGVKALHYPDGNLQYKGIYRLHDSIAEYTADTIEEVICLAGLMISNEQYTEFIKDETDDEQDIRTTRSNAKLGHHITIDQEIDVYKIFLNCFKNTKLKVSDGHTDITLTKLFESALSDNIISLSDMGNILDLITSSMINELKVHNLVVVEQSEEGKNNES